MKIFCKGERITFPKQINKLLLIMRLSLLLSMALAFNLSASVYSQNTRLDIHVRDITVRDLLKIIESKSNIRFFYSDDIRSLSRKISLSADNESIDEILSEVLSEGGVTYKILDNNIVVITPFEIFQTQKVTGTITDAGTGEAIPGVNIVIDGTTVGTVTDMDGKYSIEVSTANAVLIFSSVGYNSERVEVGGRNLIDIRLIPDIKNLEEIVVVGYGTAKKGTLTGSVATTRGDEVKKSPSANVSNSLVGRIPGLVGVTRSGNPGSDNSEIYIRGINTLNNNNPLVVVDGIPNREMSRIDPSDIESISVLKDASAAIYGAQAANGVILITTKRGKLGKPVISFNTNIGFNQPTRIPEMADAYQYASMLNEIDTYRNRAPRYSDDELQKFKDGSDPWRYPNTDWFKEVFKPWSSQHYENISLSGGTESLKYLVSVGTRYQDSYFKNSGSNYKQYNFRSNIDGKIGNYINVFFDVAGRQESRLYPGMSNENELFLRLIRSKPTDNIYWPGTDKPANNQGDNAAILGTDDSGYSKNDYYVLESNLKTNVIIPWVKGLSFTGSASFDKTFNFIKNWEKPFYLYSWDGNEAHELQEVLAGSNPKPSLFESSNFDQKITLQGYLTYDLTRGSHNFKVMSGVERQFGNNDFFSAARGNYPSAAVDQLFAGAYDDLRTNNGHGNQWARFNYFGRFNYDFASKYLLEFLWRYDGSYIFAEGKRFGFFPGVSAGWRISEENFWKDNISFINHFKIRGSWGQTGNDRISTYQYMSNYQFYGSNYVYYTFGNETVKVLSESVVGNPDVTWEVANQSNIGFELQFFNKFSVEAEYFYNKRTDILIARSGGVPGSAGMQGSLPPENLGKVANQGFEFVMGYNNRVGELSYNISVNSGYAKNKILFWNEQANVPEYQKTTGHPIGAGLFYQATGIFKDEADVAATTAKWEGTRPGDIKFLDYNKDGVINDLDRVRDDRSYIPRFTGGVSISLNYKNFDFSMLVQGAAGARTRVNFRSGTYGNFLKEYADNRWAPTNINGSYPRANDQAEYWINDNTFWNKSTDYIRLKNLELGYTLPRFMGIQKLRVYVNGYNLVTLDKLKVMDPEVANTQGTVYPLQRIINTGFNLTF